MTGRSRHDELRAPQSWCGTNSCPPDDRCDVCALVAALAAAEARAAELECELAKFHADAEYTAEVVGTAAASAIDAWEARARAERARADKAERELAAISARAALGGVSSGTQEEE